MSNRGGCGATSVGELGFEPLVTRRTPSDRTEIIDTNGRAIPTANCKPEFLTDEILRSEKSRVGELFGYPK
jgi:hypothetical protein